MTLTEFTLMPLRCSIDVSVGEIVGEPHDQVVVHGHVHPLAERPLAPAYLQEPASEPGVLATVATGTAGRAR